MEFRHPSLRLDRARVEPIVTVTLEDSDAYIRGQADDTVADLQAYLGWQIQRRMAI